MPRTKIIFRSALVLSAVAVAIGASVVDRSRRSTGKIFGDLLWADGELRMIIQTQHYVADMLQFHGSGEMTKQEWEMFTVPFSVQPGRPIRKHQFLRKVGGYDDWFSSIAGRDLLLHQVESDMTVRQFLLFDPKTEKDISKPFPAEPTESRFTLNRSRTACLLWEGQQATIVDVLSARTCPVKVLARPQWAGALERLKKGKNTAVLTEDAQSLILIPYFASSSYVVPESFTTEVWSMDGSVEERTLAIERKKGKFVDAESIDGKVLLLWRQLLPNGAEDGVELLSEQGKRWLQEKYQRLRALGFGISSAMKCFFPIMNRRHRS